MVLRYFWKRVAQEVIEKRDEKLMSATFIALSLDTKHISTSMNTKGGDEVTKLATNISNKNQKLSNIVSESLKFSVTKCRSLIIFNYALLESKWELSLMTEQKTSEKRAKFDHKNLWKQMSVKKKLLEYAQRWHVRGPPDLSLVRLNDKTTNKTAKNRNLKIIR